ncbi:TIGR04255 family protein [Synergistaceae bacterium OttesenSCG-928-D05]|nr:TIGR04255 family protein [Synergistaceae bacterium OttesenSCG-928-D05]
MTTYMHHFLSNVIVRADFVPAPNSALFEVGHTLQNKCMEFFPIVELRNGQAQEVTFDLATGQSQLKHSLVQEWHFFSADRSHELTMTQSFLVLESRNYSNFEKFKGPFQVILEKYLEIFQDKKISRIGLRYIDTIDLKDDKTKKTNWHQYWSKYISSKLLGNLEFVKDDDKKLTRQMNLLELNYERFHLKFQYGIFNEDYPAPVKKQIFILDTDTSTSGIISLEEIPDLLKIFHDKASNLFEISIKEPLRRKMGVVKYNG